MTRQFALPLALLIGTLAATACGQSHHGLMSDDPVAQYGAYLEQARTLSQEHQQAVQDAGSLEKVINEERAHAERMNGVLADFDQCTGQMGGCMMGSNASVDTARGDIEALRALHEQHHEEMLKTTDLEGAQTAEGQHQQRAEDQFEVMADHHEAMMGTSTGQGCGSMH